MSVAVAEHVSAAGHKAVDVSQHRFVRFLRLAALYGGEDPLMLVMACADYARLAHKPAADVTEQIQGRADEQGEDRIIGGGGDQGVEVGVGLQVRVAVRGGAHRGNACPHGRDLLFSAVLGGPGGDVRFHGAAGREQVLEAHVLQSQVDSQVRRYDLALRFDRPPRSMAPHEHALIG
jgi:hypothetical protein